MGNTKIKDKGRIEEIARLGLHEDKVDEILNDYVQRASAEFNLPVGLVSIVLDDAQFFAASHGLNAWMQETNGTPVEWSFCATSVETEKPFIVEDAEEHNKVKDNPLVKIDGIRCYAGVPMITSKGYIVGNFCVIGDETRSFSEKEIARLKEYAAEAIAQIEARAK